MNTFSDQNSKMANIEKGILKMSKYPRYTFEPLIHVLDLHRSRFTYYVCAWMGVYVAMCNDTFVYTLNF